MAVYFLSIFICPENAKTQYGNHIQRQDSETTTVLNTALNSLHKNDKNNPSDQMKRGQ